MSKQCLGWTLVEMLVASLLLGLSLSYAAGAWHDWLLISRRASELNRLQSMIRTARLTAMSRHHAVVLCPSDDSWNCTNNWGLPKMLFEDSNRDGRRQSTEPVIRKWSGIPRPDRLHWRAFRRQAHLMFLSTGMTDHQNGTFLYCPEGHRSDLAKGLILTKLGRVRVTEDANKDGLQDGASGRPLICEP